MRKMIISFCLLFAALSLKAQSISGIRIDGGNNPILVYFGETQMCLPTTTCFVANLKPGYYTVEVYATRFARPGERTWRGERLYSDRVYFDGSGIKDILVQGDDDLRPNRPGGDECYPDNAGDFRVMNPKLFNQFFDQVKNEPFHSDRIKTIETALVTTYFTSAQCLRLVNLYSFDDEKVKLMKLMYPRIADKQAFFTVVDTLTFSSNKDEMNNFMKSYGKRR